LGELGRLINACLAADAIRKVEKANHQAMESLET